eukprot:scaffold19185_cov47-Cyclotella_meneghiniana.AAC.2
MAAPSPTPGAEAIAKAPFKDAIKGRPSEALDSIKDTLLLYNINATTLTSRSSKVRKIAATADNKNYIYREDKLGSQYMVCAKCMHLNESETTHVCPVIKFKIISTTNFNGVTVEEVYPHNYNCCSNESGCNLKVIMESKNGGQGYRRIDIPTDHISLGERLDEVVAKVHKDIWDNSKTHFGMTKFYIHFCSTWLTTIFLHNNPTGNELNNISDDDNRWYIELNSEKATAAQAKKFGLSNDKFKTSLVDINIKLMLYFSIIMNIVEEDFI